MADDLAEIQTEKPVSYRWRQPGNKHWIYDPTPEWIEDHRHEIELEPLYNAPSRSPAVKADEDPTQTVLDAIHSSDYDCIGEDGDQSGTHAGYRHKGNRLSQPGMGWQPIEMAPRDGTKILLRFDPPFYDTMETGIAVGCANADGTWWLSCIWAGSSPHRQPIAWASIPSTDGERA